MSRETHAIINQFLFRGDASTVELAQTILQMAKVDELANAIWRLKRAGRDVRCHPNGSSWLMVDGVATTWGRLRRGL